MPLLSSWLLLGRPAENASDANCASFLEARLGRRNGPHSGLWFELNAMLPPLPKHAPVTKPNKPSLESVRSPRLPGRAKKVERWQQHATLPQSPVTRDIVQEITSLYLLDPHPAIPSIAQVNMLVLVLVGVEFAAVQLASGLTQGCPASCMLYIIGVDPLLSSLQHDPLVSGVSGFVDDWSMGV